jgi:hypothetical protein
VFVPDSEPAVAPNVAAGLLFCARALAKPLPLTMPSVDAILAATGGSRSQAYELAQRIQQQLAGIARPVGRPLADPVEAPPDLVARVREATLRFVLAHPGCAHTRPTRARYSDAFRRFIVELREQNTDLSLDAFARATTLPLGTLEDWTRRPDLHEPDGDAEREQVETQPDGTLAQIEMVLAAYRSWHGDFSSFCKHVRRDLRIDLGRTAVASILFAHRERTPKRRGGRSRDEHALRDAFETFFPGAQWVGDGKTLKVVIDGQCYRMNLELMVDAASSAAVGIAVTPEEDGAAVCAAFADGVQTTGENPLALLLDNRPSNHTDDVEAAIGDTLLMRSTPGRPQGKAHVEGTFGLFAQQVPPICIDTRDHDALALSIASLITQVFFRVLNRAPRRDRHGQGRVDLYAEGATDEQIAAARQALHERMQKLERARRTRAERLDPAIRALLDDAFTRLELLDPKRHVRDVIAGYSRDAIVDGIATYTAKRERGTLPEGVDARYLLGIVRNTHHLHEADAILDVLLRERLDARDRFLEPLVQQRQALLCAHPEIAQALDAIADAATAAHRELDRHFWIDTAASLLEAVETPQRTVLLRAAARRIHRDFDIPPRERARLARLLVRKIIPVD